MVGREGLAPTKPEARDLQSPVIAAIRPPHIRKKNRFKSANYTSVDYWNFCSSNGAQCWIRTSANGVSTQLLMLVL